MRNVLITICIGRVWIVIRYFLFEKQAFNGNLKVIGVQRLFPSQNKIIFEIFEVKQLLLMFNLDG